MKHPDEDTLLKLVLQLHEHREEMKIREHLEQCPDCHAIYRKLQGEAELIGSIDPEIPEPSIELPFRKHSQVSNFFKIAALLIISYVGGYVTSEILRPDKVSVVPQYYNVSVPKDSPEFFVVCESDDLVSCLLDTSRTEDDDG